MSLLSLNRLSVILITLYFVCIDAVSLSGVTDKIFTKDVNLTDCDECPAGEDHLSSLSPVLMENSTMTMLLDLNYTIPTLSPTDYDSELSPMTTPVDDENLKHVPADRIPLYLMGFCSITVNANGWSSAGVLPAIEMAIDDINNRHDILPEYELIVEMKDSQCNEGKAIQGFYEHISSPPTKIMILGGGCSVATVPVARTAPYFGLTQMAYSAASPELSQRSFYPSFFRTAMSDLAINKPIIELCKHFNWKHVATIHEQDDMFTMTINQFHYLMSENNLTLVTAESFLINPTQNINNIIRKDARIIFFNGYEGSARQVFCQVFHQKVYGARYQWIIPGWYNKDWMDVNDTMCTAAQVREAAMYAIGATDLKGDFTGMKTVSGMTYADYEYRYNNWPTLETYGFNAYHPNGYDAVWAIALTLNISAAIIASENTTEIVNGTLNIRPKRLDDFRYSDTPEMSAVIFATMTELRFHGVSGPVAFELGERKAVVELTQIQDTKTVQFSIYVEETNKLTFIEGISIEWHGEGPPKSSVEPKLVMTYKNEILVICACVLAALGVILAISFLAFNIKNREHRHIKMSSPRINNLIICGSIMAYVTVVLYGLDGQFISDDDNIALLCTIRSWFISIGFTMSFGGMFAKTWRVHVIFTGKFSRVHKPVHDIHLFAFVGVLLLIDVGIMTSWTIIDTFDEEFRNVSEDQINDIPVIYQITICNCEHLWWWLGALYAVNGLLLVFGCFLAWETRNVRIPGFNDSKFIGLCVYNVVIMCMVGVTVTLVLPERDDICYAFQAFCIMFCAYTSLCMLFIPKIRHVLKNPNETGKSTNSSTFKYTVDGMRKRNGSSSEQFSSDYDDALPSITRELEKKDGQLSNLQRKYSQLVRVMKDVILTDEQNGSTVHVTDDAVTLAVPKSAEVRRASSLSYPPTHARNHKANTGKPENVCDGHDNLAFC